MNWTKNLRLSVHALVRARSRTLLSASGMSVGIATVVVLFGLAGGAERAFKAALEGMGRNLLAVAAGRTETSGLRGAGRWYETLTLDDMQSIVEGVATVERAAPIAMAQFTARQRDRSLSTTVIGTTPAYGLTNNATIAGGRFFDDSEVHRAERVAVLGAHVVRDLFAGEHPLGERVLIGTAPFRVIGILAEKGVDPTGSDQDNRILVPIRTAQRRLMNVDHLDRIFVQTASIEALEPTALQVRAVLRERHGLDDPDRADDFSIRRQDLLLATLRDTDRSLRRLLIGLAALTLGLASVGLLATSLLSVRERRAEIGLRLTVGAQPHQILLQFLAETVLISICGALGGLLTGTAVIILGESLMGWRLALTWEAFVYPFLLALVISAMFGAYPAWRAARLDPIVALRRP